MSQGWEQQVARLRALSTATVSDALPDGLRRAGAPSFTEQLRKLWFDTCLYTRDSIELLLGAVGGAVGVDRCVFGTEKPGTGR